MGMGHCKTESEWTPDFIFPEVVLLIIFWLPLIIVSFVKSPKRKAAAL